MYPQVPLLTCNLQKRKACQMIQPIVKIEFLVCKYPIRSKRTTAFCSSGGKPVLTTFKRNCFHPGISSISTNNAPVNDDSSKQITSKDMLKAMLSYIWPKVSLKCDFLVHYFEKIPD